MNQYQHHNQELLHPNQNRQPNGQPINHSWPQNPAYPQTHQNGPQNNSNYPNSPSMGQQFLGNNVDAPSPGFLNPNRVNLPGHIGSPMNVQNTIPEKQDTKLIEAQAQQKIFLNKTRFETELEFVQCLANPQYVHFLAQRGYFKQEKIINYIKYLNYWRTPEYCRHLRYPQCLAMLELLKYQSFREAISNQGCAKFIEDQMILQWQFYNRKRDRIRAKAVTETREKLKSLETKVEKEVQDGMKNIC